MISDNQPFMVIDTDREKITALEDQVEWLQTQVKLLMGTVALLAEAESFRIKKFNAIK